MEKYKIELELTETELYSIYHALDDAACEADMLTKRAKRDKLSEKAVEEWKEKCKRYLTLQGIIWTKMGQAGLFAYKGK